MQKKKKINEKQGKLAALRRCVQAPTRKLKQQ
jgi:hypothetical protein